jgi:hypothetical protein
MKLTHLFLLLAVTSFVSAADLTPQLGTLGEKLLEETFSGSEVPKGWAANTGSLRVLGGVLLAGVVVGLLPAVLAWRRSVQDGMTVRN